jgi:hypothetical protein
MLEQVKTFEEDSPIRLEKVINDWIENEKGNGRLGRIISTSICSYNGECIAMITYSY